MAEFDARADTVDVTRIMERIRRGIRDRDGAGDADRQAQELAGATLDRCLEPLRTGSDAVERNRRLTPPGRFDRDGEGRSLAPEPFEFNEDTVYVSSRGTMGKVLYLIRRLLNPVLRLFFNPDPIILAMMRQAEINSRLLDLLDRVNAEFERTGRKFSAREEIDALNYEVTSNLVTEMTRLAVDMKNHKLLVESVAGRLDFDERRARALESVGQARSTPTAQAPEAAEDDGTAGAPTRPRRRRRRSRRRPGGGAPSAAPDPAGGSAPPAGTAVTEGNAPEGAPTDADDGAAPGGNAGEAAGGAAAPDPAPPADTSAPPPESAPSSAAPAPAAPPGAPAPDGDRPAPPGGDEDR